MGQDGGAHNCFRDRMVDVDAIALPAKVPVFVVEDKIARVGQPCVSVDCAAPAA
jgi:hypothetical protein